MADVSVSVMDFAEDIAEPIVPILEALGMIGGDGDDLDLEGWDLEKALGFIASYQRTSAILSILDLIESAPTPILMHRSTDGHVTDSSSSGSVLETWYPLLDFNEAFGHIEVGVTLSREMKSTLLSDGTNAQKIFIGLFARLTGVEIGSPIPKVVLDAMISLPLLRVESDSTGGVDSTTMNFLLLEDSIPDEEHHSAISIHGSIRDPSGSDLSAGTMSCESVDLLLAISRSGVDVDLGLSGFSGSANDPPTDVTVGLVTPDGFSPDYNQLLDMLLNSLSGYPMITDHLLPIIGLNSSSLPTVPDIGIIDVLMGMDEPNDLVVAIKEWAVGIITDTTIPTGSDSTPFEAWIRHLVALITGSDPGSGMMLGDGTEASPWVWSIPIGAGSIDFNAVRPVASDGSVRLDLGITVGYTKTLGSDFQIAINLDADLLSLPLSGGGGINFLSGASLGMDISKTTGSLLAWNPGEFSTQFSGRPVANALDNFAGSIGSAQGGIRLDSSRNFEPYLELHNVVLGGTDPRMIDLLSGGLLDDVMSMLDAPFRDGISDLLAGDPYLQRIGALVGLVCPRNDDPSYAIRTTGWEASGTDLRIGGDSPNQSLSDLFTDPAGTIGRYHRTLLEMAPGSLPSSSGHPVHSIGPWGLILEAIVDIVHSIISEAQGGAPIPIRGGSDDSPISITQDTDVDIHRGTLTPSGVNPPFILEVDYHHSGSDIGAVKVLPYIGVDDIALGSSILIDVALQVDLLSMRLPDPNVAESQADQITWLPGARMDVMLHGVMDGLVQQPIPLLDIASMKMSIDNVRGGLEWVRDVGIGHYIEANGFQFEGSMPDLSGFLSGLGSGFDLSLLDGLSWDGLNLHFPDGSFIRFSGPDWGWYISDGSGGWNLDIDFPSINWPITIPGLSLPGGITIPTLDLSGFSGFNFPSIDLRSLDGSFDFNLLLEMLFPSFDFSGSWSFSGLLELPQIRGLIGRFLALRGGRFGLFLSGFFRLDLDMHMFDLGRFVGGSGGFSLPNFDWPDLPDGWRIARPSGFGLGPFSLPLDWPELDWGLTLSNPFEGLRDFLLRLFTGCSLSGEPFALPALRWLWGLFTASLPDIRLPDLGWGKSGSSGIQIPDIPLAISGNGTYDDPWAIRLTVEGVPPFEMLVWLDPDGLPRPENIQEIFALVGDDVMDIINEAVTSLNAPVLPSEWTHSVASMIHRLSGLHPAVAHAIGRMGQLDIQIALERFDKFLRSSDGIVTVESQGDIQSSGISWANQPPSGTHNANHLNSLRTPSIVQEAVTFHAAHVGTGSPRILFVAPEWLGVNPWSDMIAGLSTALGGSTTQTTTDIASLPAQSLLQIQSHDLTSLDHNAPFHVLVPTLNIHPDSNAPEFLAHQVRSMVQRISGQSGEKVFLIGHSVGGLAIRYYTEGYADLALDGTPTPPETLVCGAMTISTPHHTAANVYYDENRHGLILFMHILRLIGSIGEDGLSSIDPSSINLSSVTGSNGRPNHTEEYLRQLSQLLFDSNVPPFIQEVMSQ